MMWIDKDNNKINKPKEIEVDGIVYPRSVFSDEAKLNELGIQLVIEEPIPDRKYYTYTEELVGNVLKRTPIPRDIEVVKKELVSELVCLCKDKLNKATEKYSPAEMASWENLEREAISYLQGTEIELCTMLKDEADMSGQDYTVLANEVVTNANDMRTFRTYVVSNRYNISNQIMALDSIDNIKLFLATPYQYTITEDDIIDDIETTQQMGDVVTRYKNNLKDW